MKAITFPVATCSEHWMIRKNKWRKNAFELKCCRKLLRTPWIDDSIDKARPDCSLEAQVMKLELKIFTHNVKAKITRVDLKKSKAGKNEAVRR